jgi:RNA polymerase sigma factor (sigma-70 family)
MENNQAKQLISEYYRYIESVANRYRLPEHHQDLMQVGRIAAVQSYSTYDPTKSNDIKGHICANIKYAISKYVDENLRTIRIPNHILYSTDEEDKAMMITTLQLDLVINDEGGTVIDLIPSDHIDIYPEQNETSKSLKNAISQLKPEYREVIEMYFDLGDQGEPMTLREIAKVKGKTHQNIADKLTKAITKLQGIMGADITKIRKSNK